MILLAIAVGLLTFASALAQSPCSENCSAQPTANTAPNITAGPILYNSNTPNNIVPYFSNNPLFPPGYAWYTPPLMANWGSPVALPGSVPYQYAVPVGNAPSAPLPPPPPPPPTASCTCRCPEQ